MKLISLFIVLVFTFSIVLALPEIKNFTMNDGLPSNLILAIAVDDENGLWAGTDSGLVYYDGKSWKVHTQESTNKSLHSSFCFRVGIDKEGTIFVGCGKFGTYLSKMHADGKWGEVIDVRFPGTGTYGISTFTFAKNSSLCFTGQDGWALSPFFQIVNGDKISFWGGINDTIFGEYTLLTASCTDSNGNIIIGTYDGCFYSYDYKSFTKLSYPSLQKKITSVHFNDKKEMWCSISKIGIAKLKKNNTWHCITLVDSSLQHGIEECVSFNDMLWIRPSFAGVRLYQNDKLSDFTTDEGLVNNAVKDICTDNNGNLWVATDSGLSKIEMGIESINSNTKNMFLNLTFSASIIKNKLHLDLSNFQSNTQRITVYSLSGKIIYSDVISANRKQTLDIGHYSPSIYIIQLSGKQGVTEQKCISF